MPKFALEPHRLFNQCNKDVICNYCGVILSEPFIMCAQCSDILLCLYCFATGKELRKHKNFHAYFIQHDNFALFSSKWTAQEEKLLLDSILRFGYGNWEEIAKFMETKSADECEKHYLRYYVDSLGSSLLPKFKDNKRSMLIKPYLYNLECLDEPPRYQSGTIQFNMLAGYRPARNEFDYPYDANAETILNNINYVDAKGDKPLDKAIKALHCGVVRAYNHRLM